MMTARVQRRTGIGGADLRGDASEAAKLLDDAIGDALGDKADDIADKAKDALGNLLGGGG